MQFLMHYSPHPDLLRSPFCLLAIKEEFSRGLGLPLKKVECQPTGKLIIPLRVVRNQDVLW
jgi:hypothetical protein